MGRVLEEIPRELRGEDGLCYAQTDCPAKELERGKEEASVGKL